MLNANIYLGIERAQQNYDKLTWTSMLALFWFPFLYSAWYESIEPFFCVG